MIGFLIGLTAAVSAVNATYGLSLLDRLHHRYPQITGLQIKTTGDQGPVTSLDRTWSGPSRSREKRVLLDAMGNEIGTLSLESQCARIENADKIRSELSRRIYSIGSLGEPDPFVAGAIRAPSGQAMIDAALEGDPALVTLAFHVTPPGSKLNVIVASSFGRIGKPGDADDDQVVRQGKTLREITNNGKRVAIELPLLDARGHVIGALSTSFRLEAGNADQMENRAVMLRNALARRTPSLKALFRPATVSRQVGALNTCRS